MLYGAMNFPIWPVLQELEAFSELGFDYVELTMDPPQAHYKVIRDQTTELLNTLDRLDLGLVCHLPTFISTADLTDSIREASLNEVLESLEVAAILQPLKVVLHPSYITGLSLVVPGQAKQYAMRSLETIVRRAHQLGLCICIENMFPQSHSLVKPEDFVEILERFPSLNLTLDTGHAHIGETGEKRSLEFIKRFPKRIGHLHVNDNFGKEDNHLPVGAGTVDFSKIVTALREIGYNDTVTLEVFSNDRDYLKISREKIAALFRSVDGDA
jgi:sugar phosphate isomerase/epimerase